MRYGMQLELAHAGATVYAVITNPVDKLQVWDAASEAWADRTTVDQGDASIDSQALNAQGYFVGTTPVGFTETLACPVQIRRQVGVAPDWSADPVVGLTTLNDAVSLTPDSSAGIAARIHKPGTIFLATTGNDANSGEDWSKAKLTLSGAIAAVPHGGRVVIGPGTFTEAACLDVHATKRVELAGCGPGITVLACTSASPEMGVWLAGGSHVHDLSIVRTGYTANLAGALRIEGPAVVERIDLRSTCGGLWLYSNAAGDKQIVRWSNILGTEYGVMFGGRTGGDNIHCNGLIHDCVVETKDYIICQASAIIYQNADGLVVNCEIHAEYPTTKATSATGEGSGPQMAQGVRATEYSRVKVTNANIRCGTLHTTSGNHARAVMADLNSAIHVSGSKITTFSKTVNPTSLKDLYADVTSSISVQDVEFDTAKTTGSIVAAKGAVSPVTLGRALAIEQDGSVISPQTIRDALKLAPSSGDPAAGSTDAALAQLAITVAPGNGDGDTAVNHNTGGADNLRLLDGSGNGIDGAAVRAYLKSEYDADPTTATLRAGPIYTGADGRWVGVMMLNGGLTYTIVFSCDGYNAVTKEVTP